MSHFLASAGPARTLLTLDLVTSNVPDDGCSVSPGLRVNPLLTGATKLCLLPQLNLSYPDWYIPGLGSGSSGTHRYSMLLLIY